MPFTHTRAVRFLEGLEVHGIKLGLENIRVLLSTLSDPQRRFRSVLVGGTNGKGSVAAMLSAIATRAGLRVGLFTSPHLVDCRERIQVSEAPVSKADLARLAGKVSEASARALRDEALSRHPTYFEAFTAMAFQHFKNVGVDLAVLEVGMGGRYDATNVVTPLLSVITNVSLDHTQYLGKTVREIAVEKAGICKPRVPVLTAARERALLVIRGRARQVGAPLHEAAGECRLSIEEDGERPLFRLQTPVRTYQGLRCALRGRHQLDNARLAVRAAELLSEAGVALSEDHIRTGIESVRWPGRLDARDGRPRLLLDAAHNPEGARTLRQYLRQREQAADTIIVMGLTAGRDPREMARLIAPLGREAIFTRPPGKASIDPVRLKDEAARVGVRGRAVESWQDAMALATKHARRKDLVVVTGSLYLVGSVIGELEGGPPRGA